jgi:hypothetical protein
MEAETFDTNDKSWTPGPRFGGAQVFARMNQCSSQPGGIDIVMVELQSHRIIKADHKEMLGARAAVRRMVELLTMTVY